LLTFLCPPKEKSVVAGQPPAFKIKTRDSDNKNKKTKKSSIMDAAFSITLGSL